MKYWLQKNKITLLFAFIFALEAVFSISLLTAHSITFFWNSPLWALVFVILFVVLLSLFLICLSFLYARLKIVSCPEKFCCSVFSSLPKTAFILLIFWLPYLILAFPGSLCSDVMWTRTLLFDSATPVYTTHHPLLTTFFYNNFEHFLEQINCSQTLAIFFITLIQEIACAFSFAFLIQKMNAFSSNKPLQITTFLFIALLPLFGSYAQWIVKDTIAAAAFVWWFVLFLLTLKDPSYLTSSKTHAFAFVISSVLAALLRNNAFIVLFITLSLLTLFFLRYKQKWKQVLPILLSIFLMFSLNYSFIFFTNAESDTTKESGSLLYSISDYYQLKNGEATEEEKVIISDTLGFPYEELGKNYNPSQRDDAKSKFNDQADYSSYIKAWIAQGIRRPDLYFDALAESTWGYWSPINNLELHDLSNVFRKDSGELVNGSWPNNYWINKDLSVRLSNFLEASGELPVLRLLYSPGLYGWITLFCMGFICYKRKFRYLVIFVPIVFMILSCMVSPLGNSVRYIYPVLVCSPIMFAASIYFGNKSKKGYTEETYYTPLHSK